MNVGIIGAGGVGGYFGGKLARLLEQDAGDGLRVYFVARGRHLEEIRKNGLILSTVDEGEIICRPTLATDDFENLPGLDLCLVCVKSYDLPNVLQSVKNKIKENTDIIPLLNGVDIYERVRAVVDKGVVYPSCVYVGACLERYGKVTQDGGSCTILFGKDPQRPGVAPTRRVFELFGMGKVKYRWCEDPYQEIWKKYIFISAYGMMTASENKTIGQILEDKELRRMVLDIMNETAGLARKLGVALPEGIVEESLRRGEDFPYGTKTSFQRDFERKDRPNEQELFGDTIIRLGESSGVGTPTVRLVNDRLKRIKNNKDD